jgi:predicted Zn-dependent protease with MMP-like domain
MELEPEGIISPDFDPHPGVDPIVASIEDALAAGRDDEALALCEEALAAGQGDRLDILFLAGDAQLGLGDPVGAEARFREVLAADATCASSRCWLAMALYRQCRFDEAEAEVALAKQQPEPVIDIDVVEGLLLERRGKFAEADACFQHAASKDAEKYPAPVRMSRAEFDREVKKACKQLPRQFRNHLERVPVVVQDLPAEHLLTGGDSVLDPDLLGLFDGISLPETAEMAGTAMKPNYIYLFQRNLERFAKDRDDLVEQIRVTVYHELGHYLGLEEDDMDELGLA